MKRRVDASMDLLNVIRDTALDPGYRASDRPRRLTARLVTFGALVLAGVMIAISAAQSTRADPQNAVERQELIARIQQVRTDQDKRRAELATLETEIQQVSQSLITDPVVKAGLEKFDPIVGTGAVVGPGISIVVDDADQATQPSQLVTDRDLRQLVNGLWQAGAEAISINGHRLSMRTAIRSAGSAITVDYTSLVRPYTVEAIGNPRTLAASFAQTAGASWWNSLRTNYGLRYELRNASELKLSADPGLGLGKARSLEEQK